MVSINFYSIQWRVISIKITNIKYEKLEVIPLIKSIETMEEIFY